MSTDLETKFNEAQERVQGLPERPDNNTLLELYAFYKQGSEGDVNGPKPGMMDMVGRAKYNAWSKKKGASKEEAMQSYVDLVDRLVEG